MADEADGIRQRLASFFIRRPCREDLIDKGLLKNRPVFGCSLEELCRKSNRLVPEFVKKSVERIEDESMITMEGVYRIPGYYT